MTRQISLLLLMLTVTATSKRYSVVTLNNYGNSTNCESNTYTATTIPATNNYCHNAVKYLCNKTSNQMKMLTYESFPFCHGVPVETEFDLAPRTLSARVALERGKDTQDTHQTECQNVGVADHFVYSCSTTDAPVVTYETDGNMVFYVSSTCTFTFDDSSQKYTCCGGNQIAVETYDGNRQCKGPSSVIVKQDGDSSSGWTLSCSPSSGSACPKARTAEEEEGNSDNKPENKQVASEVDKSSDAQTAKVVSKKAAAKKNPQGLSGLLAAPKAHEVPKPLLYLCAVILGVAAVAAVVMCVGCIRRDSHTAVVVDRDSYRYHAVSVKSDQPG